MNQKSNEYKTGDLNVVCVLKYFGCELIKTLKDRDRRIWYFERSERMDEILEEYWQGRLMVNIVNFLAVQRFMKSSLNSIN